MENEEEMTMRERASLGMGIVLMLSGRFLPPLSRVGRGETA